MFDGDQRSTCLIVLTSFDRYVHIYLCVDLYSISTVYQPIKLFISAADDLYGPITVIRQNGRLVKKIRWSVFKFSDADWARVLDAKSILEVRLSQDI